MIPLLLQNNAGARSHCSSESLYCICQAGVSAASLRTREGQKDKGGAGEGTRLGSPRWTHTGLIYTATAPLAALGLEREGGDAREKEEEAGRPCARLGLGERQGSQEA